VAGAVPVIKILWEDWADQSLALPAYATAGAAGADIRANLGPELRRDGLVLEAGARALVPAGIRIEIPLGFEVQIRPRSGLALKHGVSVLNAPGTIDSDYRGPVGVLLVNHGSQDFVIAHGDRIAQMIVARVVRARIELANTLSASARGSGGYGSTGLG